MNDPSLPQRLDWFDERLDDEHDPVKIAGEIFSPSDVLFSMAPAAYEFVKNEYNDMRKKDVFELVDQSFPQPITFSLKKFTHGSLEPVQKVFMLRDVWEKIIWLLHALVISECRRAGKPFQNYGIKKRLVFSDGLSDKLDNMQAVIKSSENHTVSPIILDFISEDVVKKLIFLNKQRNRISHDDAPTNLQAEAIINDLDEPVISLLESISNIQNLKLLRFIRSEGNLNQIICNDFVGSNTMATVCSVDIDMNEVILCRDFLNNDHVIALYKGSLFNLCPFVHAIDGDYGHTLKLGLMKHKKNCEGVPKLAFSVIAGGGEHLINASEFQSELQSIDNQFGVTETGVVDEAIDVES